MIVSDPLEDKLPNVVRVCIAIPTMGYCQVEAYCNRLINFMHLGKMEEGAKVFRKFAEILASKDKSIAEQVITEFVKDYPIQAFREINGNRFEFRFAVIGKIFTPVAREEAAKMCIEWNCDYLYMIDDDMLVPDDMFEKLYAHNVDIVAPLAFTRNYPHKPVIYASMEGYDSVSRKDWFMNTCVMNYPKDQLVECDAVGFGSVLIKRWVLDKMSTPRFMSTCGTGEDVLFCYNAKKIGARVFMDTSVKLGHLSHPLNVTEEYVEGIRKEDKLWDKKSANGFKKYEPMCVLGD